MILYLVANTLDLGFKVSWYIVKTIGLKAYYLKYGYPITDHDRLMTILEDVKDLRRETGSGSKTETTQTDTALGTSQSLALTKASL